MSPHLLLSSPLDIRRAEPLQTNITTSEVSNTKYQSVIPVQYLFPASSFINSFLPVLVPVSQESPYSPSSAELFPWPLPPLLHDLIKATLLISNFKVTFLRWALDSFGLCCMPYRFVYKAQSPAMHFEIILDEMHYINNALFIYNLNQCCTQISPNIS